MGSSQPESGQVMVKLGVHPVGGCVAAGTIGRKVAGWMIGIGGAFEVFHMAAVAVRRCAGVAAGEMAWPASLCRVGSRKCEFRGGVIESCACPMIPVMAAQAIMTEAGLNVIRILGCTELLSMTTEAVLRSPCEPIADMALNASPRSVCAGQGKCRVLRMIKTGIGPGVNGVALAAGYRQPRLLMIRILARLILPKVAGTAGSAEADKPADGGFLVAGVAINGGMRTEERETVLVIP